MTIGDIRRLWDLSLDSGRFLLSISPFLPLPPSRRAEYVYLMEKYGNKRDFLYDNRGHKKAMGFVVRFR